LGRQGARPEEPRLKARTAESGGGLVGRGLREGAGAASPLSIS